MSLFFIEPGYSVLYTEIIQQAGNGECRRKVGVREQALSYIRLFYRYTQEGKPATNGNNEWVHRLVKGSFFFGRGSVQNLLISSSGFTRSYPVILAEVRANFAAQLFAPDGVAAARAHAAYDCFLLFLA